MISEKLVGRAALRATHVLLFLLYFLRQKPCTRACKVFKFICLVELSYVFLYERGLKGIFVINQF